MIIPTPGNTKYDLYLGKCWIWKKPSKFSIIFNPFASKFLTREMTMETSFTIRRKISSVGDLASTMTKKRSKRRRSRPLNDPSLRGQNNRTIIGGFDINRLSRLCRYLKKVCFVNNEIKIYFLTFFLKTKKFFVTYTTRVIPSFYNKLNKANVIRSSFHHIIWKL